MTPLFQKAGPSANRLFSKNGAIARFGTKITPSQKTMRGIAGGVETGARNVQKATSVLELAPGDVGKAAHAVNMVAGGVRAAARGVKSALR